MHIVRRELVIPLQVASVGIERDDAAGIEIVAIADVAIHVRPRIADAPIDEIQLRIVGAGDPGGSSTELPRLAGPAIAPGFAVGGNSVESPDALSGVRVVSIDKPACAELGAGHSGDDEILDDERRSSCAIAFQMIGETRLPQRLPG